MCHGDDRKPPIGFRVVAKKGPKFITKIGGGGGSGWYRPVNIVYNNIDI